VQLNLKLTICFFAVYSKNVQFYRFKQIPKTKPYALGTLDFLILLIILALFLDIR